MPTVNKKYLDLDGLSYYNGKVQAKIDAEKVARTAADSNLQSQINGLASGSPLVASSTAGMTDTSRVYVNTSDGHWYYWNGSAWTDGGVYQSTGLANDSVFYNALTAVSQNDEYITLSAEDLPWIDGWNYYLGSFQQNSTEGASCPVFRVSKGTVIEISNIFKCRITFWGIDGTYIGNTGTFAVHESTTVAQDGWAVITISPNPATGTFPDHSDITNTNIKIKALRDNKNGLVNKKLTFAYRPSFVSQAESNKIYVGKGTVVKGYGYNMKSQGGITQDSTAALYVICYDRSTNKIITQSADFTMQNNYVVAQDCYIQIRCRLKGAKAITEETLARLHNLYEIDYVTPENPPLVNDNYYQSYISNNSKIEIHEGGYGGTEGSIIVRWDNNLIYLNGSPTLIYELNMDEMAAMFPNNAFTFNDKTFIQIPANRMLYIDLDDNTMKIANWRSDQISSNVYPLVVNAYQNVCGGAVYEIYLKQQGIASEIFNSAPYQTTVDWRAKVKGYNKLLNTTGSDIETFTFFTDQHLMGDGTSDYMSTLPLRIGTLQKLYNSTPMNFIVSGGDWLNNGDSVDSACFKLGYVDGFMKSMFKNCYLMVGNHDTNYQGEEQLSTGTLTNLWFREEKKPYYSFDGKNSKNYVFDSGLDWDSADMNSYRWEQIDWFAKLIKEDDPSHATVFSHIVWYTNNHPVGALADNFTKVIKAFNDHSTITLNGQTYDFTAKTGHIDYVLSGHLHEDYDAVVNGVQCIATNWFGGNSQAFDLVLNDYDAGKVKMVRVGTGSDREFNI